MDGSDQFAGSLNPYESPQSPSSARSLVDEADPGPWRDDALLVMRVDRECSLPMRCVITGVSVGPEKTYFRELTYAKSFSDTHNVWLEVSWPVIDAARPRMHWAPTVGVVMSIAVLIFGIATYRQAAFANTGVSPQSMGYVATVIAIVSAIVASFTAKPFLSVVDTKDGFAWIAGAHADFLRELPPWPGGEGA